MTAFPDDVDGRRLCSSCEEWKPAVSAFYLDRRHNTLYRRCKDCFNASQRKGPRFPPDTETGRFCSDHQKMEPFSEFYFDLRTGLRWRRCKAAHARVNHRPRSRTSE